MKQIVDKLNKIAKAIDENVALPTTNLITDSLDAITKALGGTPNDSNLIVDKLEDIAGVARGGSSETEIVYIPEQTVTMEAVEGMGNRAELTDVNLDPENPLESIPLTLTAEGETVTTTLYYSEEIFDGVGVYYCNDPSILVVRANDEKWYLMGLFSGTVTVSSSEKKSDSGGEESLFKICNLEIDAGNYSVEFAGSLYYEIPPEAEMGEGYFIDPSTISLDTGTYQIVVPKTGFSFALISPNTASHVITTTGDIQMFEEGFYMITGDCKVISSNPEV